MLAAAPAHAQLWVLGAAGQPTAVERAELAYAMGDGAAATWLSLRVERGPVAVLAALEDGARVESAVDAWFVALEDVASPSVVPPKGADDCRALRPYVRTAWPRSRGVAASELRLETPQDVVEALLTEGVAAPSELPAAAGYALWIWPDRGRPFTTRTLRVVGSSASLALEPGSFPVSVSALGNGPLGFEAETHKHTLPITYVAAERPSADYRERLAELLGESSTPLVEARARSLLFDWSIYADVVTVAPLVNSYAEQAGGELPELDARACRQQLAALREAGAPDPTACSEALDAGLALGLLDPAQATLQRFQISAADGVQPASLQAGGEASQPFLRALSFDGSACPSEGRPPMVGQPPLASQPGANPAPVVVVEERVVVEETPVELSCGGEPGPEPVDDYGYGYGQSEDCSSDTSSSSEGAGGEVDCASDSSSSSSSDDGCSGDTSSESGGYDGETCTGSAAPRAEPSALQTTGPRRPRRARLKASAWALGFVALVLPIRRRKRRSGAGG